MQTKQQYIAAYRRFREEIDAKAENLSKIHRDFMQCKKGCGSCCEDFGIFPIEFFSICDELNGVFPEKKEARCAFLHDGCCSIYRQRPLICRTHGLPLLRMNEEGTHWELNTCKLNFTHFDFGNFHTENTLQEEVMNSRLFMLNRDFIKTITDKNFTEMDKIAISQLKK